MNPKIRFVLAGLGHIGRRHLAEIQAHPQCQLVATCDPVAEAPGAGLPHFRQVESLLAASPEFDVLTICTPNGLHAGQAIAALRADKHIVVEKPMALHRADCETMLHEALSRDKKIFVVMQNRWSPVAQWLKKVVSGQFLGDIFLVEVNCYWNRDDRYYLPGGSKHAWRGNRNLDGGPLFTQFSHFVDLLYWVFGQLKLTDAQLFNFHHKHSVEFEDTGIVLFKIENGGAGRMTYTTAAWNANLESSVTVLGSRGSIKISGQYLEKIESAAFEGIENCPPPAAGQNNAGNHAAVLQNVVDVLQGKFSIGTNALEGMKVVEFIEQVYQNVHV